jgi:hypothetical protein
MDHPQEIDHMLQNSPQGKPWVLWVVDGVWWLLVFLTIPFAWSIGGRAEVTFCYKVKNVK